MPTFKYKPYYEYKGPTLSDPLREKLSPEDSLRNINYFFDGIDRYFEGGYIIERVGDAVSITGEISEKDCDDRVKKCLNSLDLFAIKVL